MCDEADLLPQTSALSERVESHDLEAAGGRARGGGENTKQSRLACAVLTQHRHVLAGVNGEVDRLQRDLGTKPVSQPIRDEDAHLLSSAGVLISGQSTNGPAANSRIVATMSVIGPGRALAASQPQAPLRVRRRCPAPRRG